MRVLAILGGLLVGLVGLFMSVCGGGFLATMGLATLRNIFFAPHRVAVVPNVLLLLVFPAVSLWLGILVCRSGLRILRQHTDE